MLTKGHISPPKSAGVPILKFGTLYTATVDASNFKFGTELGVGEQLTKKQLLRPKLTGSRLGEHPKNWNPFLFLQPLKLSTSNFLHNLGLASTCRLGSNNNFSTKLGRGWLGYGSTSKTVGTIPYQVVRTLYHIYRNVIKLQYKCLKKTAVQTQVNGE